MPLAVSRATCFSEAAFDGTQTIEGVTAELVNPPSLKQIQRVWRNGNIPLVIDPEASVEKITKPDVIVDARMLKQEVDSRLNDAPMMIGIGVGFYAGRNVHAVIESNHSNNLGKVILEGEAENDTGLPVAIAGLTSGRVLWADEPGIFTTSKKIGDSVAQDEVVGYIDHKPLKAPVNGMLRGLLRNGVKTTIKTKLVEVDPVNEKAICFDIRDKFRAIGGGVLEAILMKFNQPKV